MKKLIIACLYSNLAFSATLSSYSESHIGPKITAPTGLLQFVLDSEPDDAKMFNDCVVENNLNKQSYGKLFIVSQANLTSNPNETYFVRPALKPFCMAFYGAHLFRYWFVKVEPNGTKQKFSMLLQGGGDGISVLAKETKGLKNLSSISHTAMELYTSELKYDGKKYNVSSCIEENYQTKKIKPCE